MADLQVRQIRSAATSHQQEGAIVAPAGGEIKARSVRPAPDHGHLAVRRGALTLSWSALAFGLG
jgi:hypothetical protein